MWGGGSGGRRLRGEVHGALLLVMAWRAAGQQYLTLRYHGRYQERFKYAGSRSFPQDSMEICMNFVAVCAQLRLNQCVKAPPELTAPWVHQVTEGVADAVRRQPPSESDAGIYMILTHNVPIRNASVEDMNLQLWSGCSANCMDCARGQGLALYPVLLPMCSVTQQGGVFGLWYNPGTGGVDTDLGCVDSLTEYYDTVVQRNSRVTLIIGLATGGVAILMFTLLGGVYWSFRVQKARLEREARRSVQEGRAQFQLRGGPAPRVIGQAQIEEHFPLSAAEGDETCVVCLLPITGSCRKLQCSHTFHADCILHWWVHKPRSQLECPLCKRAQELPTEDPEAATTDGPAASPHEGTTGSTSAAGADGSTTGSAEAAAEAAGGTAGDSSIALSNAAGDSASGSADPGIPGTIAAAGDTTGAEEAPAAAAAPQDA